jgi:hypothetical protein
MGASSKMLYQLVDPDKTSVNIRALCCGAGLAPLHQTAKVLGSIHTLTRCISDVVLYVVTTNMHFIQAVRVT